ncbi:hypothetical protein [Streptomyces sp. NPDC088910]|uniref:hypothetical protein n=1 Tax=Streptomyces sp. NPDC088910 TaxID=3365911 RepID=UPI0037F65456
MRLLACAAEARRDIVIRGIRNGTFGDQVYQGDVAALGLGEVVVTRRRSRHRPTPGTAT